MTYKCAMFNNASDLTKFLNAQAITPTNITQIYFDGASGKHILIYQA